MKLYNIILIGISNLRLNYYTVPKPDTHVNLGVTLDHAIWASTSSNQIINSISIKLHKIIKMPTKRTRVFNIANRPLDNEGAPNLVFSLKNVVQSSCTIGNARVQRITFIFARNIIFHAAFRCFPVFEFATFTHRYCRVTFPWRVWY